MLDCMANLYIILLAILIQCIDSLRWSHLQLLEEIVKFYFLSVSDAAADHVIDG